MRANPRMCIRPAARTHAHIHIYTHVHACTRTRRKFSDTKSALQHFQTEFNHQSDTIHFYCPITVQSISILAPHWLRHLYKLSASVNICRPLSPIRNHCPTIYQLLIISCSSPIHYHRFPPYHTHHIPSYPISSPTNSPSYQYVSML